MCEEDRKNHEEKWDFSLTKKEGYAKIKNGSQKSLWVFRGSSMVEQAAVNRKVEGSSPSLGAISFISLESRGSELADIPEACNGGKRIR